MSSKFLIQYDSIHAYYIYEGFEQMGFVTPSVKYVPSGRCLFWAFFTLDFPISQSVGEENEAFFIKVGK